MRFRLFPSDLEGVGSYRVLYPYGCLEAFGGHEAYIEVDERAGGKAPLIFPAPEGGIPDSFAADVYVFQRRLERWFPGGSEMFPSRTQFGVPEIIRWLQQNGKTVVVEVDDWMHGLPIGAPAVEAFRKRPWLSVDVLAESIQLADIVTVSTPALAEAYTHRNVHVLGNFLNWDTWKDIEPVHERDRGRVRVGWMGSLAWRGRDLSVLQGLIGPWLEKHPDVEFVAVGGDEPHDYLGIPVRQRRTLPYRVFPGHAEMTQEIDIGLAPLEFTRFNECKSALKGLEYAACGIPVIATPTGPYREWVEPGVNGLLAKRAKDWLRCLDEMLADDAWRAMGAAARLKAEQHTIQGNWQRWEAMYAGSGIDVDAGPAPVHTALLQAA